MISFESTVLFIDIEASGLGTDSFPIEIGWARLDDTSGSWVIRPAEAWSMQGWDETAEALHGITPEQLEEKGQSAWDVAAELDRLIGGQETLVLSDAPEMDGFWLDRLFEESPLERRFELTDFGTALRKAFPTSDSGSALLIPDETRRHRAEADAVQLCDAWQQELLSHHHNP